MRWGRKIRTHVFQLAKGVNVLPVWLAPPALHESQWLNRVLTVLSKLAVDRGLANPQYAGSSDLVSVGFFQRLHKGVPFYRSQPVCVRLCESIVSDLFGNQTSIFVPKRRPGP